MHLHQKNQPINLIAGDRSSARVLWCDGLDLIAFIPPSFLQIRNRTRDAEVASKLDLDGSYVPHSYQQGLFGATRIRRTDITAQVKRHTCYQGIEFDRSTHE